MSTKEGRGIKYQELQTLEHSFSRQIFMATDYKKRIPMDQMGT